MFTRRVLLGGTAMSRFIDPIRHIERATDEQHGVLTSRELSRQIDQGRKIDAQSDRTQRFIVMETIEVHCPNPAAAATTSFGHLIATSSTGLILSNLNPDVSQQCRLLYLRIMADGSVTGGTITPVFDVYDGLGGITSYQIDECELSTAVPIVKSVMFDWPIAIQLAKGDAWSLSVVSSAGYTPVALDYKALLTFGFEQWI